MMLMKIAYCLPINRQTVCTDCAPLHEIFFYLLAIQPSRRHMNMFHLSRYWANCIYLMHFNMAPVSDVINPSSRWSSSRSHSPFNFAKCSQFQQPIINHPNNVVREFQFPCFNDSSHTTLLLTASLVICSCKWLLRSHLQLRIWNTFLLFFYFMLFYFIYLASQ